MSLHHLYLLMLCLVGGDCNTKWNKYTRDPAFSDQMCPGDQVEFQAVTRNALSCVRKCSKTPGCTSLVYLNDNNTCFGIRSGNPFSASSPLPGAVFYRASGSGSATTAGTSTTPTTTTPTTTTTPPTTTTTPTTTSTTTTPTTTSTAPTTTTTPTTTSTIPSTTPSTPTATTTTTTPTPSTTTPTTAAVTTTTAVPDTPLVEGLSDSQFTASSVGNAQFQPWKARFNINDCAWNAATKDLVQWIQVDFLHEVVATRVATKGIPVWAYWVESYKVLTSTDSDCSSFITVKDHQGNDKVFTGNTDGTNEVQHALKPPVVCRCLRINPQTWNVYIALRFEVLGHFI